jgi:DNA-binding FadR family transcriptional regulator
MFDPDVLGWHLEAGIDKRFLRDLADIRLAVEPRAAALAAERWTGDAVAILRDSVTRMRSFASDSIEFADADLRLHLDVATISANPFMRSIGAVIEAALRASFRLSAPTEESEREITLAAHEHIVDAIADRDAEAASAAMVNVIFNGLRRHGAAG